MRGRSAARTERSGGIGSGTVLTALLTVAAFAVPAVPASAATGPRTGGAAPFDTLVRSGVEGELDDATTGGDPIVGEDPTGTDPGTSGRWTPSWTEEFSGTGMTSGCGSYGGGNDDGANAWSPDQVTVSGDRLHLGLVRRENRGNPLTSGGVGCWGRAQTYGRFEIRARVPRGKGLNSQIVLWPENGGAADRTGIELLARGTETAYITNGWGAGAERTSVPGRYSDTFHTYVIEWTPQYTRIVQDGKVLFRSERSYTGSRWLGLVVSSGDRRTGLPGPATPLPADFQIDRISVWHCAGSRSGDVAPARALSLASAVSRDALRSEPAARDVASVTTPDPTASTASGGTGTDGTSDEVLDDLAPSIAAYTAQDLSGDDTEVNLTFRTTDWGGLPWLIAVLAAVVAVGTFRCSPYLARLTVRRGGRSRRGTQQTHG